MAFFPTTALFPKGPGGNLNSYNGWYAGVNYAPPAANGQFLDPEHHQAAMYYGNPHFFPSNPEWSPDYPGAAAAGAQQSPGNQQQQQQHQLSSPSVASVGPLSGASGSSANDGAPPAPPPNNVVQINHPGPISMDDDIMQNMPATASPPVTLSGGSTSSSPGTVHDNGSPINTVANHSPSQKNAFVWMTKTNAPTGIYI